MGVGADVTGSGEAGTFADNRRAGPDVTGGRGNGVVGGREAGPDVRRLRRKDIRGQEAGPDVASAREEGHPQAGGGAGRDLS